MTAAITGHQNLGEASTVEWVRESLSAAISQHDVTHGYTALAIGADQMFAEILLAHEIPYTAVLPCREIVNTFETPEHLQNYRRLLHRAAAVETLAFVEPSEQAFFAAGKRVVELAELVIAVWNGLPARGLGGTADVVKYALAQHKRVLHINLVSRQILT